MQLSRDLLGPSNLTATMSAQSEKAKLVKPQCIKLRENQGAVRTGLFAPEKKQEVNSYSTTSTGQLANV